MIINYGKCNNCDAIYHDLIDKCPYPKCNGGVPLIITHEDIEKYVSNVIPLSDEDKQLIADIKAIT